jgi:uncharacterized protein (TIGR00304 family)
MTDLFVLGSMLVIIGIFVLVVATILAGIRSRKGRTKAAGVIIVGPVPIIFGSDKNTVKGLLKLALALTVLLIVAMLVYYLLLR